MTGLALRLATVVLEGYLAANGEAASWKKLEKKFRTKDATQIWKAVLGKNPPVEAAPAPKPEPAPVVKPKPATKVEPVQPPVPQPAATTATTPAATDDFAAIKKFRNSSDCSKWPVTVQISNVRIEGKNIAWDETKGQREKRTWNVKTGKKSINGETILLIPSRGEAGMFDYLGVGQTRKTLGNLFPGHEGQGFFAPWQPTKGEKCGFCIATISRDKSATKMQERSNVLWFTWP
jgi:hypothetical protein